MENTKIVRLSKHNMIMIEDYRMELQKMYSSAGFDTRAKEVFDMSVSDLLNLMLHDALIFQKRRNFVKKYGEEV